MAVDLHFSTKMMFLSPSDVLQTCATPKRAQPQLLAASDSAAATQHACQQDRFDQEKKPLWVDKVWLHKSQLTNVPLRCLGCCFHCQHTVFVLQVAAGSQIPADLLFLSSSDSADLCYMETANLDGETNLKLKYSYTGTKIIASAVDARTFAASCWIECEKPNDRCRCLLLAKSCQLQTISQSTGFYILREGQSCVSHFCLAMSGFLCSPLQSPSSWPRQSWLM